MSDVRDDIKDGKIYDAILMGVTMEVAQEGFERAQKILSGFRVSDAKRAVGYALARAGRAGRTMAKRAVTEEYNLSPRTFSAYINNLNHFETEADGELFVVFGYQGYSIPLIKFVRSKNTPIYVSVIKGQGGTLDHAFFATVGEHDGIFERVGEERFPIKELYGPAAPQMMYSNEAVLDKVDEKVAETFEKRLDHEIYRFLNGYGRW